MELREGNMELREGVFSFAKKELLTAGVMFSRWS